MHLLVPFAAPLEQGGVEALGMLALPQLRALWPMLAEQARDTAGETSLTPPHERAWARAAGLAAGDGCWPLAAVQALRHGVVTGAGQACGRLTPAHWRLGTQKVILTDPDDLTLDESSSRALLEAVRSLFESEGFSVQYVHPTFWLVSHPSLADLPCASIDRVIGRNVDAWMPAGAKVRLIRRLQNEVQMLLHTSPLNDAREAHGELPVNSFWLSGCGVPAPFDWPADLQIDERLRASALRADWPAWAAQWSALDAGPIAELAQRARRGEGATLMLCGERTALTLTARPRNLLQRMAGVLRPPDIHAALEAL
jgi:hypothetical protein